MLLRTGQTCVRLGICRPALNRLVDAGLIACDRIGNQRRFTEEEVARFLAEWGVAKKKRPRTVRGRS